MISAGIILQARMGSRRLPGKALKQLDGRPILEQCLRRLIAANAGPVVLATTCDAEDDVLARAAHAAGAAVFRGSDADVLDRYARCAEHFELDVVLRATGDNPAVDMQAPARLLAAMRCRNADYVWEDGLPYGAGVEAVTRRALAGAARATANPYDREHVTPFIKRRPDLFRLVRLAAPAPIARPDVRLTVDTADDLVRMRDLYHRAGNATPSVEELIAAWDAAGEVAVA
jgi:spore coat polysaccharide biosynthesis protein SpsF